MYVVSIPAVDFPKKLSALIDVIELLKAEEKYFTDNKKDLEKYAPLTFLLKSFAEEKVDIQLNNKKNNFTITVKAKDSCNTKIIVNNKKNTYIKDKCAGETSKLIFFSLVLTFLNPFLFLLQILLCLLISKVFGKYKKIFFNSCIISTIALVICIIVIFLFQYYLKTLFDNLVFNCFLLLAVISSFCFTIYWYLSKFNLKTSTKIKLLILTIIINQIVIGISLRITSYFVLLYLNYINLNFS